MTRFGGTRALTAVLIALLASLGTAQRAMALDPPNEAPDVVLPVDGDTDEDSPYNFVNDAITLTDPDAGTDDVRLDLSVTSGVLHVADTTGLTFVDGSSNDSDTLAMTGSLSAFDAALDLLQFMPAQDDTQTVTLTAAADDLGHNGDGGAQTDSDTMDITVNPVNDAPVVTVPGTQTVAEDGVATFSVATTNAVSVDDVDAAGSDVQLTLTGSSGKVTLATTTGLSFSAGDGTADSTMTFTGTLTALNTALDGVTFTPDANFAGSASLSVDADDQGNTGSGGTLTDSATIGITVDPVTDAPVVAVPGTQSVVENTVATFSVATTNAVSVSDIDAAGNAVQLTLAGTSGKVTLATTTGLSFSVGDGTADSTMTFTGTLTALNTALNGMTFTPDANFAGSAHLSVDADDQGNTGSGGPASNHQDVTITVTPVIVPPAPRLKLSGGSVAVSSTGHLTVPVTCADAACAGTLALQSGGSALGTGTISVAAGASGTVAIDLNAAGRALVSSRASVDVIAVMTVTGASTTAGALTLTAAKASAVKLLTGKAHVRAGKAKVKLSCGSDGPCSVTYVLTATIGGKVKTLATVQLDLAAGASKTLKLKLAKAVKKALRRGAVEATQTATSDIAVGIDSTTTQALKLVT